MHTPVKSKAGNLTIVCLIISSKFLHFQRFCFRFYLWDLSDKSSCSDLNYLSLLLISNHNQPVTSTASLIGKSKASTYQFFHIRNSVKYRYVKHECDKYPPTKTDIYPHLGKRKIIFKHTQGVQDMLGPSKGMYFGSWFIWTFPSEIPSPRRTWPEEKRCERA